MGRLKVPNFDIRDDPDVPTWPEVITLPRAQNQEVSAATRNWPPKQGVRVRLVSGVIGTELLSDVPVRCDDPQDPAPDTDWQTEARIAADFGLLVLTGAGNDQTVTRTQFGDAWAATLDPADPLARVEDRWPLPGPGKFEVEFFPLTRPTFPVFALTGPTVASIRPGGWNLDLGFGQPGPNPVTQVEMRSTLRDGTFVSVQTATGERWALPALRVSDLSRHGAISERLLTAMADRSAPWQVRPLDVDGTRHAILVLDLLSDALPAGITGPGMLAVGQLDDTQITIICDDPTVDLSLTTIPADDLIAQSETP